MALIKIEYPNGGGFEVEGNTEESTVALADLALAILWGRKKYGNGAVALDEMDRWLSKTAK